jgi:hypothetical protein
VGERGRRGLRLKGSLSVAAVAEESRAIAGLPLR